VGEGWNLESAEGVIIDTVEDVMGQTSDTRYDLLFTTSQVIAAIVLHPSDLTPVYTKRAGLQELALGAAMRMRQVQALSRKIENERRQGFKNKTPDEILRTHRASFKISYKDILSAKVIEGLFGVRLEFDAYAMNGIRRKFKFKLHTADQENVRRLLNLTLPGKVV
jgi:hypothetical protein